MQSNFSSATFIAKANFTSAWFVCNADFGSATFEGTADFRRAWFIGAQFWHARFNARADFTRATFIQLANFFCTTFACKTDFRQAVFNKAGLFSRAVFNDAVSFFGDTQEMTLEAGTRIRERTFGKDPSLDFQHAEVAKPERFSFHTLVLRPHWFVNVDPRKFVFTDVDWKWDAISIETEIDALRKKEVASPDRLLEIACRQLADNAEANNRYEEASRFRYWAMECRRQEQWAGFPFWKQFWNRAVAALTQLREYRIVSPFTRNWLHWLYWVFSGYGERIRRSLAWLIVIWIVFAVFYTRVGFTQPAQQSSTEGIAAVISEDKIGHPIEWGRALTYSLAVMSLQKPEPKPLTGTAQTLVLLETILGPVQAALLALAIRRKFMR